MRLLILLSYYRDNKQGNQQDKLPRALTCMTDGDMHKADYCRLAGYSNIIDRLCFKKRNIFPESGFLHALRLKTKSELVKNKSDEIVINSNKTCLLVRYPSENRIWNYKRLRIPALSYLNRQRSREWNTFVNFWFCSRSFCWAIWPIIRSIYGEFGLHSINNPIFMLCKNWFYL